MRNRNSVPDRVVEVRRRGGKLNELRTLKGRRFLVVKDSLTEPLLEVGAELDEGRLEKLEGSWARSAGIALSYRMLTRRDRTEWEIRNALAEAGIGSAGVIEDIVEDLKGQGYLDDQRLAREYVRFTVMHRPSGPHLVRHRLGRLGVARDTIERVLTEELTSDTEHELALRLARGKLGRGVDRKRSVRKINAFLLRRGFSSDLVNGICARILRGEITGEDDE
ncbi:MAG: RecX family transcriptional regulator [bacterium]|nr:MAG: RecX family transcriptional regulator [bacterium]